MVDDYGLIGGIGQGIQQGLLAYQRQKQLNRENQIQNLTSGVETDADGNLQLNAQAQQRKQAQSLADQRTISGYDPDSDYSKGQVKIGNQLAKKFGLGNTLIPEGTTAADVNSENGLIGKGIAGGAAIQAGQTKANSFFQAAQGKNQSFADRDTVSVSKDYETQAKPFRQVNEDVAKIEGTLNTKDKDGNPLITKQQMGDVNAAIARIYSPGHMSDATVDRTEYESAPAAFAGALQKWSTNPQDIGSKQLIDHIVDQAHHLANVSNQNAQKELDSLDSGYQNLQVPSALKTAQDKSNSLRKRFSVQYPEAGQPAGQGLISNSPSSAPAHPGGLLNGAPATVQMRDPKGNIRAVPADQVEAAKAAGGTPL